MILLDNLQEQDTFTFNFIDERKADTLAFLRDGRCEQRSARINYYLIVQNDARYLKPVL